MGKHNPNTTEFSAPHKSTTPKEHGNKDSGKMVVTSRSYDSDGKKVRNSAEHHDEDSVIFEIASWFFGRKK